MHKKTYQEYHNFLEEIEPFLAKILYMKFRYGILQIRSYTSKWKMNATHETETCTLCTLDQAKNIAYTLFFCTVYNRQRRKWMCPLCKNLGYRKFEEVLRVLKSDTSRSIMFALSRYLLAVSFIHKKSGLKV